MLCRKHPRTLCGLGEQDFAQLPLCPLGRRGRGCGAGYARLLRPCYQPNEVSYVRIRTWKQNLRDKAIHAGPTAQSLEHLLAGFAFNPDFETLISAPAADS